MSKASAWAWVVQDVRRAPGGARQRRAASVARAVWTGLAPAQRLAASSIALSQLARLEVIDGPVKVEASSPRAWPWCANVRGATWSASSPRRRRPWRGGCRCPRLPPGLGGQFENQQRAAARLALVVPLALALIVGLLFATLGSLRQALLVFANIPLALVGGVAHWP